MFKVLQLVDSHHAVAKENKNKKEQISAASTHMVYLTACHNSAAEALCFSATRSVAALHRATATGGAVMEANVGVLTATLGGLNKDQEA